MKHLFLLFALFACIDLSAQVYPDEFPIDPTIQDDDAVYTQEKISGTRTPRKFLMSDIKDYISNSISGDLVTRTVFIDSLESTLAKAFQKDDSLFTITDATGLLSIAEPVQNDMAINATFDTLWFYSNATWNPFSGGSGGGGSGTIDNTQNTYLPVKNPVGEFEDSPVTRTATDKVRVDDFIGVGRNPVYNLDLVGRFRYKLDPATGTSAGVIQNQFGIITYDFGHNANTAQLDLKNELQETRIRLRTNGPSYISNPLGVGGILAPSRNLHVRQSFALGENGLSSAYLYTFTSNGINSNVSTGYNLGFYNSNPNLTGNQIHFGFTGLPVSATSDKHIMNYVERTFNPSSGNASFETITISPTINQTGSAAGKTHGLRINPILTSAFDFRGLQVDEGKSVFLDSMVVGVETPTAFVDIAESVRLRGKVLDTDGNQGTEGQVQVANADGTFNWGGISSSNEIYLKDYQGVGITDSAALVNAFEAAQDIYGTLYMSMDTLSISENTTLTVSKPMRILADKSIIYKPPSASTKSIIDVTYSGTGFEVYGLELESDSSFTDLRDSRFLSSNLIGINIQDSVQNVIIHNCEFREMGTGIKHRNSENATYDNNRFLATPMGILARYSRNATVSNNYFNGESLNFDWVFCHPIYMEAGKNPSIIDNHFYKSVGQPLHFKTETEGFPEKAIITGNTMEESDAYVLQSADDVIFSNNIWINSNAVKGATNGNLIFNDNIFINEDSTKTFFSSSDYPPSGFDSTSVKINGGHFEGSVRFLVDNVIDFTINDADFYDPIDSFNRGAVFLGTDADSLTFLTINDCDFHFKKDLSNITDPFVFNLESAQLKVVNTDFNNVSAGNINFLSQPSEGGFEQFKNCTTSGDIERIVWNNIVVTRDMFSVKNCINLNTGFPVADEYKNSTASITTKGESWIRLTGGDSLTVSSLDIAEVGYEVLVSSSDNGNITILTEGSEEIEGIASYETNQSVILKSNGQHLSAIGGNPLYDTDVFSENKTLTKDVVHELETFEFSLNGNTVDDFFSVDGSTGVGIGTPPQANTMLGLKSRGGGSLHYTLKAFDFTGTQILALKNSGELFLNEYDQGDLSINSSGEVISSGNSKDTWVTVTNANSPYALLETDDGVKIDASGGVVSITLAQGANMNFRDIPFIRMDNNPGTTITIIASTGSILGTYDLSGQYFRASFLSDTTDYYAK